MVLGLASALVVAACSILTSLGDLGPTASGTDGSTDTGATLDGTNDAPLDAAASACDGGSIPDLVGYYKLDEGSGLVAHDCSGKGHDGTILRASAGTWTTGIQGGGVRVLSPDGCIDLGDVPDFVMTGGFTVMTWAHVDTFPDIGSSAYLIGKTLNVFDRGWRLHTASIQEFGAAVARPGDAGPLQAGKDGFDAGIWQHVAARFEPNKSVTVYVDGAQIATLTWSSALIEDTAAHLRIGCRGDNSAYLVGVIDEVRIYRRALTPSEIAILSQKP